MTMNWKHHGVRVVHRARASIPSVPQTQGMSRAAAINFARVGAEKIWAGTVSILPNAKTGAHHHGAVESVIYVRQRKGAHALGRTPRVHRGGGPRRFQSGCRPSSPAATTGTASAAGDAM